VKSRLMEEKLVDPPPKEPNISSTEAKQKTFPINSPFENADSKGIIHTLTNGITSTPRSSQLTHDYDGIVVTSSGVAVGDAHDFIFLDKSRCWTTNIPYSWYCVDFGQDRLVLAKNYSLGYGSSGTACIPRYWILQGSKNVTKTDVQYSGIDGDTPQNDLEWRTLAIHNNDSTINSEWGFHTWKLNCVDNESDYFRYFRVVQTGPNAYIHQLQANSTSEDNWSQVLVASHFELYGTVINISNSNKETEEKKEEKEVKEKIDLRSSNNKITRSTPPAQYGSTSTAPPTKYVQPQIIRAHPSITKEIQELLVYLVRPNNDAKPEQVKVHDIFL